jgi:hypothetical protein
MSKSFRLKARRAKPHARTNAGDKKADAMVDVHNGRNLA